MPRRHAPEKKDNTRLLVTAAASAVVLVGGMIWLNSLFGAPAPTITATARDWGSPNAPVMIEEYSDFQ